MQKYRDLTFHVANLTYPLSHDILEPDRPSAFYRIARPDNRKRWGYNPDFPDTVHLERKWTVRVDFIRILFERELEEDV